jgi:hypothetical protein
MLSRWRSLWSGLALALLADNFFKPNQCPSVHPLIARLEKARAGLIRTYVLHVIWFVAMCCFAVFRWDQQGLKASVLLTLVTVPPVLFYTVRVHKLCRAIDPKARTVGLVPVILITIILSPFESGLVLPAKNWLAASRLLRSNARGQQAVQDRAGKTRAPTPLGGVD